MRLRVRRIGLSVLLVVCMAVIYCWTVGVFKTDQTQHDAISEALKSEISEVWKQTWQTNETEDSCLGPIIWESKIHGVFPQILCCGTHNGYFVFAKSYSMPENAQGWLTTEIGAYNFWYPDQEDMLVAMLAYKDGEIATLLSIYEAGQISDPMLAEIYRQFMDQAAEIVKNMD